METIGLENPVLPVMAETSTEISYFNKVWQEPEGTPQMSQMRKLNKGTIYQDNGHSVEEMRPKEWCSPWG